MDLTAADKLTVTRAASVPLVVVLYAWSFPNHDYWATAVFCVAMTTDWFDGQLARRQGHTTSVGSLLDPFADKWRAFGWDVARVDGHDHAALLAAFDSAGRPRSKPLCIIADTIKGKGVSFMENQASWHHGVPNAEQYQQALAELEQGR